MKANNPIIKTVVYVTIAGTVLAYVPLLFTPKTSTPTNQPPAPLEAQTKQVVVPFLDKEKSSETTTSTPTSTKQIPTLEGFSDLGKEAELLNGR